VVGNGYAARTYPLTQQYDPAAFSNLIGFFSPRFGQSGLEATYGSYLNGERDTYSQLRNTLLGKPQVGDDLHLTIDARLQAEAMRLLVWFNLLGAAFLVICDTLSRTMIPPTDIPVGVLTALGGGPFFLWLLRTKRRNLWA